MRGFTSDPIRDANAYDRELADEEQYCYYCERKMAHERALRIQGALYCMECAYEKFGEEIEG